MPLLLLLPLAVLAAIALLPLSLVMRYRVGTARRPARGWMIALNLIVIGISTALFLLSSAVTSAWIPRAFPYTVLGLAAGSPAGSARAGVDAMGSDAVRLVLHAKPDAHPRGHPSCHGAGAIRILAQLAGVGRRRRL